MSTVAIESQYLDVHEAAAYAHVSERSIRRWVALGTLRADRIGTLIRIKREALDEIAIPVTSAKSALALEAS